MGQIVLLDAATSPRSLVTPFIYLRNGETCAWIDRPGTLVQLYVGANLALPASATPGATPTIIGVGSGNAGRAPCHVFIPGARLSAAAWSPPWLS